MSSGGVALPHKGILRIQSGFSWLTLDGDAKRQSWNTHNLIRYDRCAYRLTLDIPDHEAAERLLTKDQLEQLLPGSSVLFDGWPGSENWRVFKGPGPIPPEWITDVKLIRN